MVDKEIVISWTTSDGDQLQERLDILDIFESCNDFYISGPGEKTRLVHKYFAKQHELKFDIVDKPKPKKKKPKDCKGDPETETRVNVDLFINFYDQKKKAVLSNRLFICRPTKQDTILHKGYHVQVQEVILGEKIEVRLDNWFVDKSEKDIFNGKHEVKTLQELELEGWEIKEI